jgi:hypothetical protein
MGAKKFSLEFISNPSQPTGLVFAFGLVINYDTTNVLDFIKYWSSGNSSFIAIKVKPTLAETIQETVESFETIFLNNNLTDATISVNGNTIEIIFGNANINVTGSWKYFSGGAFVGAESYDYGWGIGTQEAYNFDGQPVYNDAIVLSRSPYWFRATPGIEYDSMTLNVYLYSGHQVNDRPVAPTYTLSKSVVQAGQSTIGFDIHSLINDRVQGNVIDFGGAGASPVNFTDTVWCYVEADVYLADNVVLQLEQQLLGVDGFGYHSELFNPQIQTKVLSSITNHIVYDGTEYPLYFLTEGLTEIIINGVNVDFDFDTDYNSQNIGYVNLAAYIDNDTAFTAAFEYGATTETHNVTVRTECRYTKVNCLFKNKYGVYQSLVFPKLSKNDFNRTAQDYTRSIANVGQYNLNTHSKRNYLTSLSQKITVNTDFLPENQNELIKELLLSEFVYLKIDEVLTPVNLTSSSWAEKTSHINKLIQYTMEFTISHDLMNNIK